jgi:7-carboxy-7-deazaguanine synthase
LSNSTPTDPELAAIHEDSRLDLAVLRELIDNYEYQLKFVVDSEADLPEIQQTIEEIGNVDSEKVMLMPQAVTRDELLAKSPMVAELCKNTGFAFCQRLQVLLWNNQKGT